MTRSLVLTAAVLASGTAAAGPLPIPSFDFEIFSIDGKGGGWVIHHQKGRGDSLWGCKDLAAVGECTQVHLIEWKSAGHIEAVHISKDSQNGWFVVSAPGMGDYLYACKDPEGAASCKAVELDLRPSAMPKLKRIWPEYDCVFECANSTDRVDGDDWRTKIEDKAKADMWVQLSAAAVGSVNFYACKNLGSEPTCQLAVPNWLTVDRADLGLEKLSNITDDDKNVLPGALVGKLDEESVAYKAGIREGDKVMKVGEFDVRNGTHAKYMIIQYPALKPLKLTMGDGKVVELTAERKPKK